MSQEFKSTTDQYAEEDMKIHPRFKAHADVLKKHGYEHMGGHSFDKDTNTTGHTVHLTHSKHGIGWLHQRDTTDRMHSGSTAEELDKHLSKIHKND